MDFRERKAELLQFKDALKIAQCLVVKHILLVHPRRDEQTIVDVVIKVVP